LPVYIEPRHHQTIHSAIKLTDLIGQFCDKLMSPGTLPNLDFN